MSLIPFPKIPNVLGSPIVKRLTGSGGVINQTLAKVGLISTALMQLFGGKDNKWIIIDKSFHQAIFPDSILSIDARSDSKVATHPVEKGSFAAYNKTQMPNEVRVVMACSGSGVSTPSDFLQTLEKMKQSTDLFTIGTSDNVYSSLSLTHYDVRREATKGATMILVEAIFVEIRQTATATYTTTQEPSGSDVKNNGQLTAQTPTAAQTNPNLIGVIS